MKNTLLTKTLLGAVLIGAVALVMWQPWALAQDPTVPPDGDVQSNLDSDESGCLEAVLSSYSALKPNEGSDSVLSFVLITTVDGFRRSDVPSATDRATISISANETRVSGEHFLMLRNSVEQIYVEKNARTVRRYSMNGAMAEQQDMSAFFEKQREMVGSCHIMACDTITDEEEIALRRIRLEPKDFDKKRYNVREATITLSLESSALQSISVTPLRSVEFDRLTWSFVDMKVSPIAEESPRGIEAEVFSAEGRLRPEYSGFTVIDERVQR